MRKARAIARRAWYSLGMQEWINLLLPPEWRGWGLLERLIYWTLFLGGMAAVSAIVHAVFGLLFSIA